MPQMICFSTSISEHKGNLKRFSHMSASHSLVPNQIFLRKKHSVAKKWNWENCLHVLSLPNSGNFSTSEVARPPDLTDKKASYNGLDAVGPCMRLSLHVSNVYDKMVFTCLTWKQIVRFPMDANTIYVLEPRLISRDGATQMPISEIGVSIWHNSRVCVWYFQVYKFKYLISEKNCGFSYINLVQTVDDKRILCCVLNSPLEQGESTCTHFHRLDKLTFSQPLVYESCLYWSRGLFLRMVQHKVKRDGTTQEIVSGTFRVYEFQFYLLAKYFVSVSNCSCSHIHFVQTVEEKLRKRSFAVS